MDYQRSPQHKQKSRNIGGPSTWQLQLTEPNTKELNPMVASSEVKS
jgi:hypothetical protein